MTKPGIGRIGQPPQLALAKAAGGEQPDDPRGEIGIGKAAELGEIERRQRLGHVKPAILGEAREQNVLEGIGGRLRPGVAGRQIAHRRSVTYRLDKAYPRLYRRKY